MCANFSFAQELGKFRVGLDAGGFFTSNSGGIWSIFLADVELKYNFQKNMNVGLKIEGMNFRSCKCYDSDLLSFSITYDYYFHYKNKSFSPFIGAGLGYYFGRSHDDHSETVFKHNNPIGFFRIGFEFWKLRTSLTYNLVIKPNAAYINDRNLSYISFTVGFLIGGGKWKKLE